MHATMHTQYICTIANHCAVGQQSITVEVAAAASAGDPALASPSPPAGAPSAPKTVTVPWKWNPGMPWVELNVRVRAVAGKHASCV